MQLIGAIIGAVIGFALGISIYDNVTGPILLAAAGAILGYIISITMKRDSTQ